jgi:hypothetical protein
MSRLEDYARQSRYTDPGPYAALFDPLPASDVGELAAVVRNVLVHYRAAGIEFTGERLNEIDHRWVERILATDQDRFAAPLATARPEDQRVVGCCRDFTLLTVAALRRHGVPARSRIGFAAYFASDFWCDHVVVEYWNGRRWVWADAQLDPSRDWGFDTCDLPRDLCAAGLSGPPVFASAAQVWTAYRRGEIDVEKYGVDPGLPIRGGAFVRNYVLHELAHRQRDELLLWDGWGVMGGELRGSELGLIDEVAALLLAADDGEIAAENDLGTRYAADPRLNPGDRVQCVSPSGLRTPVDLARPRDHEDFAGV